MGDDLAERWRFMRPWCAPVRGRLRLTHVERPAVPRPTYVGLDVAIFEDYSFLAPEWLRSVRDALVLLSVVAQFDPRAWKHVLRAHCDFELHYKRETLETDKFQQARFLITFDEEYDEDGINAQVLQSFFSNLNAPPSDDFVKAIQAIVSFRDQSAPHIEQVDIRIGVDIDASSEDSAANVPNVLSELKALHMKHGSWRFPVCVTANDGRTPAFECAFVLGPIEIEMTDEEMFPELLELVGDAVVSGGGVLMHLTLLTALESVGDASECAQVYGRMYERVLCATGCADDKLAVLQEVALHCQKADSADIIQLCSAIAETRTTDSLTLIFDQLEEMEASLRAELWQ